LLESGTDCDIYRNYLVTKVQKQQKFTPMFHKRAFNKSDHHLMISETDKQTHLFGKKVRLYNQIWMSKRTLWVVEVGL